MVYGSAETIRVVSQIYRERIIAEASANQERVTSSNQIKLIGQFLFLCVGIVYSVICN